MGIIRHTVNWETQPKPRSRRPLPVSATGSAVTGCVVQNQASSGLRVRRVVGRLARVMGGGVRRCGKRQQNPGRPRQGNLTARQKRRVNNAMALQAAGYVHTFSNHNVGELRVRQPRRTNTRRRKVTTNQTSVNRQPQTTRKEPLWSTSQRARRTVLERSRTVRGV